LRQSLQKIYCQGNEREVQIGTPQGATQLLQLLNAPQWRSLLTCDVIEGFIY